MLSFRDISGFMIHVDVSLIYMVTGRGPVGIVHLHTGQMHIIPSAGIQRVVDVFRAHINERNKADEGEEWKNNEGDFDANDN